MAKEIWKDTYSYENSIYTGSNKLLKVTCKIHGIFQVRPKDFLYKPSGCPKCKSSRGELQIRKKLVSEKISYKEQIKFNDCKHIRCLPFDFGIYDLKSNLLGLIEYHGEQHYKIVKHFGGETKLINTIRRDKIKQEYCAKNNIPLLIIPYTKFKFIETEIKNFLANQFIVS